MVAALTPAEIREAFTYWRVPVRYVSGWEKRSNGGTWGDVTGCMFHHTGDDAPDETTLRLLINGRSDLRGPLCNFGSGDDGILDVISAGPANHAGQGDPDVLAAVRRESYTTAPPRTDKHQGEPGAIGGNSLFMGWEVYYAGPKDKTINPLQYRVTILSQAAITWALDKKDKANVWTSKSTIGHKEWSDWKPDPAGVSMPGARADIQWCLDHGPVAARRWYDTGSKATPKPPTPTIPISEESEMFLVQVRGKDPVFKSDGFRRIHIDKVALGAFQKAGVKITLLDNDAEMDAFGPDETPTPQQAVPV